ncbi:hypothetical protein LSH36_487g02041 [Paralvinella palmiformis]|uniref:Lipase domain-containing protein n=1 Tax=Paralvinella palmiformis TaxID=53620 RepID=A0AAD9J9H3_9ANNE|nr:hypothetical protein LSH36_487g02041 [Paralvinella palmiformis]
MVQVLGSVLIVSLIVPEALGITCPGLGDFNSDGAFVDFPEPTCPGDPNLELSYTMYSTSGGNDQGIVFDRNSVPSNFNPSWKTLFVVHGWNSNADAGWMADIKNRLLANFDANCVVVGWGGPGGSETIQYGESASTTRTVGAESAEVMMNLITNGGGDAGLMHCTGHSLGAHVCGHFGRWAAARGMKPDRCTGMDPAGPLFAPNSNRSVGLYTDCAQFVDIINTDWTSGSTPHPDEPALVLGHQNYFPNDGHDQPGCTLDSCSHSIAHDYFVESVGNDCFVARESCSATNDLPGSCSPCGHDCGQMGYGASRNTADGIYRLETVADAPYCIG